MNRDLSKILILGHDNPGFSLHPENFIQMAPWMGDATDETLEKTVDFLEMLAFSRLKDVRQITSQFQGKSFPEEFDATQRQAFIALRESQKNSLQGRLSKLFSFGGANRGNSGGSSSSTVSSKEEESYDDKKWERIELRRKEYARIKELMQKQLEAELQREKEYYAEHKMSWWDLFSKGPPPPPPPPKSSS